MKVSGGAVIGENFLITLKPEYEFQDIQSRTLIDPVLVTASTGIVVTGVKSVTLHFAFHLPVKSGLKSSGYKRPSDITIHMQKKEYQHVKVLIIDEILVLGRNAFVHLDLKAKAIMQNSLTFDRVSLLVAENFFLQLSLVNQKCVVIKK